MLEHAELCVGEPVGVVTLRGYLAPRRILSFCAETCALDLFPGPSRRGTPLRVRLVVGDGASQMAPLPEGYGDRDLRIRDGHGDALALDQPVLVTGTRAGEPPACELRVTWLEAAP